jgi:hypothetical protein
MDGRFGAVRVVARDVRWTGSVAGAEGEVLASWLARRDDRVRIVRVRPTRAHAVVLSAPDAAQVTLATSRRGHVLVAWLRHRRIEVRLRTPSGRWGPVRRIAPAGPVAQELHAAVSERGEAIVAWGTFRRVGEGEPGRWYFRAATAHRGAWTTHRLDTFDGVFAAALPATALPAFGGDGRGLVAWAGHGLLLAARPDGSARRSVPVAPDAVVDDLSVSRSGEVAVAVSVAPPGFGAGSGPYVVTAPAGGRLAAPVDLAPAGGAPLRGVRVAFDPVSAQPTVAWVEIQDGAPRLWTAARKFS